MSVNYDSFSNSLSIQIISPCISKNSLQRGNPSSVYVSPTVPFVESRLSKSNNTNDFSCFIPTQVILIDTSTKPYLSIDETITLPLAFC